MSTPEIPFQRNVVQPVECIKAAWELIRPRYWLFVGMCAVGVLIGSAVPLGILMGPMMSGMYLAFFKERRREPVEFGTLFKGFDYFGPSLVATLLHIVPILAIVVPAYILFYVGAIVSMTATSQEGEPNPAAMLSFFAVFALFWTVMVIIIIFISVGFTFSIPLIVDRQLQGFDAVKLSFRAAMSNFWRLLGMTMLTGLLALCGVALCYVGMFLVFPLSYGAISVAYEQVFGLRSGDIAPNLPPPPPRF